MAELASTPVSVIVAIALAGWAVALFFASRRFITPARATATSDGIGAARRILRNAAIPIVSQFVIRGIDLAVAIALLRLLGPEGNGQYAVAVVAWLYVKTISDFGLSVLAAREIARDPASAGAVVAETTMMRWMVLALCGLPLAGLVTTGLAAGTLSAASAIAIAILFVSIVPASYSEAVSSAFAGLERLSLAAWLNIAVNVVRAPLAIALAATKLEVAGVALAALVAAIYAALLFWNAERTLQTDARRWRVTRDRMHWYLKESWPLLVNSLLVSLFFRVDVFIVQAFKGNAVLGVYDAAFKLINMLTIVPAYAVLAVFPLLVRRADNDAALRAAQARVAYFLAILGWLAVVATSALARPAVAVLAGNAYLPQGADLLRILIWFAPLSFVNGVTQYVLIARGAQRRILPAFAAAVAFNFLANLALVPIWGATAAAVNTVLTEVVIAAAFWLATRETAFPAVDRSVVAPLWRPTVVGCVASVVALSQHDQPIVASVAALAVCAALGAALRVIGPEEARLLRDLLRLRSSGTPALPDDPHRLGNA